jgi:hypothetical protein
MNNMDALISWLDLHHEIVIQALLVWTALMLTISSLAKR